ncbi:hypothetical protein CAXC1_10016 [Candidatus Xenohaliotis californiensis]|uniref:Uncharacterized protein n=1 Tax=Candidatus Xenohaliotis californiensis TaxID=84677 RepID=A0ABM9N7J5_9RICK|nr:hypothetical protein CAXC1_10016 [Candidatus Xenohaliotis californiensis]
MHITLALFVLLLTIAKPRGMFSLNIAFSLYYIFCHFAPKMHIASPAFTTPANQKLYVFAIYLTTLAISIFSFWEDE